MKTQRPEEISRRTRTLGNAAKGSFPEPAPPGRVGKRPGSRSEHESNPVAWRSCSRAPVLTSAHIGRAAGLVQLLWQRGSPTCPSPNVLLRNSWLLELLSHLTGQAILPRHLSSIYAPSRFDHISSSFRMFWFELNRWTMFLLRTQLLPRDWLIRYLHTGT